MFEVAERRRKLASYEMAGNASRKFTRPERTMDSAVLSGRILFRVFYPARCAGLISGCPVGTKNALVGGAFGVTVSAAMKTLSAKAKISGLAVSEMIFQTARNMDEITMAKTKCSRCFGGVEFSKNGIGHRVKCPHCGQKTQLRLNPFAPVYSPVFATDIEIIVAKCDPAPTKIPQQRTPSVPLQKLTEETIKVRTKTGDTPLHRAAKTGRISEIPRHLLRTELFVVKNNGGQTPIHLAVRFGQFDKVPRDFLTKETLAGILHYLAICGHADQIPKEFLKPEFLSVYESGYETVLHALARADRLGLVPEIYANSEIWNLKDSSGRTARDLHQIYIEWKTIKEKVRAEPATEKQKEKLRYFGYVFDANISKGQASDAIDECVKKFPDVDQAYYNRPATEEQLAKLREINEQGQDSDEESPDLEEKVFMTYGYAKKLIQDWELSNRVFERQQIIASDLTDCEDSYWEKHHWDDDYEESERGRFDQVCYEILDGWQFDRFGELPTRKQVAKAWELVKSRKPNKSEFPTHIELVNTLPELFPKFKRR